MRRASFRLQGADANLLCSVIVEGSVVPAARTPRLDRVMTGVVERVAGGTRLFRLYELARAPALFDHFGRHGIWVRRFQHDPAWLRLGLPNSVSAWDRLEAALSTFV